MNKTAQAEWRRVFLIERLPEPLTRASAHLQLFDNYLEVSPMRLRKVRDPYSKKWSYLLQKCLLTAENGNCCTRAWEIPLTEDEYSIFESFEGLEIRKNRYFHEFDLRQFTFDVYLGPLWGLNTMFVRFDTQEEMASYESPPFAVFEVTCDPFFHGESLVNKSFVEVKDEIARGGYLRA